MNTTTTKPMKNLPLIKLIENFKASHADLETKDVSDYMLNAARPIAEEIESFELMYHTVATCYELDGKGSIDSYAISSSIIAIFSLLSNEIHSGAEVLGNLIDEFSEKCDKLLLLGVDRKGFDKLGIKWDITFDYIKVHRAVRLQHVLVMATDNLITLLTDSTELASLTPQLSGCGSVLDIVRDARNEVRAKVAEAEEALAKINEVLASPEFCEKSKDSK